MVASLAGCEKEGGGLMACYRAMHLSEMRAWGCGGESPFLSLILSRNPNRPEKWTYFFKWLLIVMHLDDMKKFTVWYIETVH